MQKLKVWFKETWAHYKVHRLLQTANAVDHYQMKKRIKYARGYSASWQRVYVMLTEKGYCS